MWAAGDGSAFAIIAPAAPVARLSSRPAGIAIDGANYRILTDASFLRGPLGVPTAVDYPAFWAPFEVVGEGATRQVLYDRADLADGRLWHIAAV